MRPSKVMAKLRAGQVVRLCAMGSFLPYYPRLAAAFGYDGIWVDGEHKPFSVREVQALMAFHHLADVDCIWRPPTRERNALYRILEDGASGLIIPHVESAEEARHLVASVRFPPQGKRGLDGLGLEGDFGFGAGPGYPEAANREKALFVQVESPESLEQVEAIASVPGVDGIFLGPGDLAFRLGCTPSPTDPVMVEVHQRINAAVVRAGKAWGRPAVTASDLELILKAGARIVAFGAEYRLLRAGLAECGKIFERLLATGTGVDGADGRDGDSPNLRTPALRANPESGDIGAPKIPAPTARGGVR